MVSFLTRNPLRAFWREAGDCSLNRGDRGLERPSSRFWKSRESAPDPAPEWDRQPPRDADSGNGRRPPTPPVVPTPENENPMSVMKRFSERFTADSAEQARRIIFGYTPPKHRSEDEPIKSPLQRQFQASAHPKLMLYFMHTAMGEPKAAESALSAFAVDIRKQRVENETKPEEERIPLDPKILNEDVIKPLVENAVTVLQPIL